MKHPTIPNGNEWQSPKERGKLLILLRTTLDIIFKTVTAWPWQGGYKVFSCPSIGSNHIFSIATPFSHSIYHASVHDKYG
jgi:hypothetical protein